MGSFANLADIKAIEAEMPWEARDVAQTMHAFLGRAAAAHGELLARLGQVAVELAALLDQRSEPRLGLARRDFQQRGEPMQPATVLIELAARGGAGHRFQPAHA